jgi:hypothetical protein
MKVWFQTWMLHFQCVLARVHPHWRIEEEYEWLAEQKTRNELKDSGSVQPRLESSDSDLCCPHFSKAR